MEPAPTHPTLSETTAPDRAVRSVLPRRVLRPAAVEDGEPVVELVVTGPGRRERAYLERVDALERGLAEGAERERRAAAELELAALVERGARRHLARVEDGLRRAEERAAEHAASERRLCVLVGSLQAENRALAARLEAARAELAGRATPRLAGRPERRGWLARLLRR